jgi:aromatic-L-amino-acid decarboxylase
VLVRDRDAHLRAFSERPDYLAANERGLAAGSPWPVDFGPELSRGYRALKVWAHLLEHGTARLGAAIEFNCELAAHLAARVDAAAPLQRMAPVAMQIVVFRYAPAGGPADGAALDALNDAIVVALQEAGLAAPSTTRIDGKLCIRINLTNHRTRVSDVEMLVDEVLRLGAELAPQFA